MIRCITGHIIYIPISPAAGQHLKVTKRKRNVDETYKDVAVPIEIRSCGLDTSSIVCDAYDQNVVEVATLCHPSLLIIPSPGIISLHILPYLHMKEIATLDSAVTSHAYRPYFLVLESSNTMSWPISRCIALKHITCVLTVKSWLQWANYLDVCGNHVTMLTLNNKKKDLSLGTNLTAADFSIFQLLPNLTSLNISHCTGIDATAVDFIVSSCPNIVHVTWRWSDDNYDPNGVVPKLLASYPRLRTLSLQSYCCPSFMSNSLFNAIGTHCKELEELKILPLSSKRIALASDLSVLYSMHEADLITLVQSCKNLRSIDFQGFNYEATPAIIRSFSCLKKLQSINVFDFVDWSLGTEEQWVEALTQVGQACKSLKYISGYLWMEADSLPPLAARALLINFRAIDCLMLCECELLDDSTFEGINYPVSNLKILELKDIDKLTDIGLHNMLTCFPQLEGLRLEGCWQVTGSAFAMMIEGHERHDSLVKLSMICTGLQVGYLSSFFVALPRLRDLYLKLCDLRTGVGQSFCNISHNLQGMTLDQCQIDAPLFTSLSRCLPLLSFLNLRDTFVLLLVYKDIRLSSLRSIDLCKRNLPHELADTGIYFLCRNNTSLRRVEMSSSTVSSWKRLTIKDLEKKFPLVEFVLSGDGNECTAYDICEDDD